MKLILASASPRRKELMELAGLDFEVFVNAVDETLVDGLSPKKQVARLAMKKALVVGAIKKGHTIIGADTIVVFGNEILGKPKDEEDAFLTLKRLSGKVHEVMTAVAIINKEKNISIDFVNITKVSFYEMENSWLRTYVQSKEPLDKAGSYGIQGLGFELVEKIEGDYYSVMGLPIAQLKRMLKDLGCI